MIRKVAEEYLVRIENYDLLLRCEDGKWSVKEQVSQEQALQEQASQPCPIFRIKNHITGEVISEGKDLADAIANAPKNEVGGVDLENADLTDADLQDIILRNTNMYGVKINQRTILPQDFDWKARGCIMA